MSKFQFENVMKKSLRNEGGTYGAGVHLFKGMILSGKQVYMILQSIDEDLPEIVDDGIYQYEDEFNDYIETLFNKRSCDILCNSGYIMVYHSFDDENCYYNGVEAIAIGVYVQIIGDSKVGDKLSNDLSAFANFNIDRLSFLEDEFGIKPYEFTMCNDCRCCS